ncbi:MAG TPA: 3-oxoadipate enol-lactonase [Natronosporangium sp.]
MTVELRHTVDGPADAPILVLGPSLGTTTAIWQPQLPALVQRFRVVRYDHRGHGRSPGPPGPYRIDDLGGDLLRLLDRLGAERVRLAGISLGGAVAGWLAGTAPDRVDRLAMLATSPRFGTPEAWVERAATVRAAGMAAIADTVIGRWFTDGFATRHAGVVGWVRQQLVTTPPEPYAACCAALETLDLSPVFPAVTAPTLVLAGADDPVSPPEHARAIGAAIPGARVEVVPDAAHLLNVEQPDRVTTALLDFFGAADG